MNPAIPHYLTNIAFNRDPVIGRTPQLHTIRQRLREHSSVVLVNGLGGIGKTTVALEFIRLYGKEYAHVAWVEVTGTIAAAFVSNTTLIANLQLQAQLAALAPETYESQGFDLIVNKLNNLPNCLLVIDNANDLDDLLANQARLRSLRAT
ncbi:MAG: AAA family ATPase, partial [Saprospiraceae bacterium]